MNSYLTIFSKLKTKTAKFKKPKQNQYTFCRHKLSIPKVPRTNSQQGEVWTGTTKMIPNENKGRTKWKSESCC